MSAKDKTKVEEQQLAISRPDIKLMQLRIVGDSPLLCNRMLPDMITKSRGQKQKATDEARYQECLYPHPDGGYGFPGQAFKKAMTQAASYIEKTFKTHIRGSLFVLEDMVQIDGKPRLRRDIGRNQNAGGAAVSLVRAEFPKWSTTISIRFNAGMFKAEEIANLLTTAGFAVGIGCWRPEKDGNFGTFHIESVVLPETEKKSKKDDFRDE